MSRAQHLANLEAYRASAEKSRVYFAAKVVELDAAIERERLRLAQRQTEAAE
jgi:hypothetical protein